MNILRQYLSKLPVAQLQAMAETALGVQAPSQAGPPQGGGGGMGDPAPYITDPNARMMAMMQQQYTQHQHQHQQQPPQQPHQYQQPHQQPAFSPAATPLGAVPAADVLAQFIGMNSAGVGGNALVAHLQNYKQKLQSPQQHSALLEGYEDFAGGYGGDVNAEGDYSMMPPLPPVNNGEGGCPLNPDYPRGTPMNPQYCDRPLHGPGSRGGRIMGRGGRGRGAGRGRGGIMRGGMGGGGMGGGHHSVVPDRHHGVAEHERDLVFLGAKTKAQVEMCRQVLRCANEVHNGGGKDGKKSKDGDAKQPYVKYSLYYSVWRNIYTDN